MTRSFYLQVEPHPQPDFRMTLLESGDDQAALNELFQELLGPDADLNFTWSNFSNPFHGENTEYYLRVNYYMNLICLPLIVLVGTLGNATSLLVFLCTHLKYQSSSIYLAFLNVADTGFLVCVFLSVWIKYMGLSVTNTSGGCRLILYLSFVFAFLSVWTVLSFTIERYIVVFYPLKKHQYCTPRRAKMVITGLGIFALISYTIAPITSGPSTDSNVTGLDCHPKPQFQSLWHAFQHADSIVTVIIPSILIILLNVRITVRIWDFLYRKRSKSPSGSHQETVTNNNPQSTCANYNGRVSIVAGDTSAGECSRLSHSCSASASRRDRFTVTGSCSRAEHRLACRKRRHYQLRTTRALVIVSTMFLVLNLPSHAFKLYYSFAYIRFPSSAFLWQNLLQLLYYTNFSVNVFLYTACSRSFRTAFLRLWRKWRHRLHYVYKMARTNKKNAADSNDLDAQERMN